MAVALLLSTTVSGLLLYSSGAHDGALSNVHVVCALALTVSIAGHLVDRRRQLAGLMRRRRRRALRCLSANLALVTLFVVSLVSGFAVMGSGASRLHLVVSMLLFVACAVHASRRVANRLRAGERACNRVPVETRPEVRHPS